MHRRRPESVPPSWRTRTFAACVALASAACDESAAGAPSDAEGDSGAVEPVSEPGEFSLVDSDDPDGAFMSAWADPAGGFWVVGGQLGTDGAGSRAAQRVLDDGTVEVLDVPAGPMLNWVHGVDGTTWMVGEQGKALRFVDGVFVDELDTGAGTTLWGVWCATPDACWSVGGNPLDEEPHPVMVFWDGAAWSPVELPDLGGRAALFKVWGLDADHVWAVGSAGLVLRWDGVSWTVHDTGLREDLISLWGRSADDIVAVGGRIGATLARWDGAQWRTARLAEPGLNGVWMNREGTAWAVGFNGSVVRIAAGAIEAEPLTSPTARVLHGVAGRDAGPFVAVGGTLDRPLPWTGVIAHAP